MRYIVTDNIFNKKDGKINTYNRENKIEPVGTIRYKVFGKQTLYQSDKMMKGIPCHRSQETNNKGSYQRHLTIGQSPFPPGNNFIQHLFSDDSYLAVRFKPDDAAWFV